MQPSGSSNEPRVLLVTKHRSGGGTEKHVAEVARALNAETAYLEDGLASLYRSVHGVDILHFYLPRPYVLGSLVAWLANPGAVRIMSRRSLRSCYQTPLIRWIEKRLHKRTRILVGNSPAVVAELREEAPGADIRLIRNAVNGKPLPREKNPTFFIVCVANHFGYKGLEDLIEAYKSIRNGLPTPSHLILIGRGTEKLDGLGWRTDVRSWLGIAGVYVQPSHEEGASNALLEAMAAGVPCIATAVGGNLDMIEHGYTGVLVPPRRPDMLANAIRAAAMCREQYQVMGDRAQKLMTDRFGPFGFDRMIDDYRGLYRDACGKS